MKIRIISQVRDGETQLLAGTIVEVSDEIGAKWIEEEKAILFEDEQPKPKRSAKAVSDGNG